MNAPFFRIPETVMELAEIKALAARFNMGGKRGRVARPRPSHQGLLEPPLSRWPCSSRSPGV
jgi:hypothetical protein